MRILHVVHQYPPSYIGGTELYTQSLSLALAKRGHEVAIFHRGSALGTGVRRREEGGVQILTAWSGEVNSRRRFMAVFSDAAIKLAFERVLEELRPNLVHVQHLVGLPVALIDSIHERDLPFLITLHDYWWVCANSQLVTNYSQRLCDGPRAYLNCARCVLARMGQDSGSWAVRGSLLLPAAPGLALLMAWRGNTLRSAMLRAQRAVAPSRFVRSWYGSHGMSADRIAMLPHGLEWPPRSRRRQESAGLLRLVYIGGLAWQKGVHVLVRALDGLEEAVQLTIAGDESFDPAYVAEVRAQAPPNVRFLGPLSRQRVWEVLSQVDAVVVPSLWHETFSLIAHEAFAAGLPVIASQVGAMTEAIRDGENGLLLPPGDTDAWRAGIQRLVNERALMPQLRANIRPPMTLGEHVSRLESVYRECVY